MPGSTLLLGGEPGAGKSTLLLQWIESAQCSALYLPTEEVGDVGAKAIYDRCERCAPGAIPHLNIYESPFQWPIDLEPCKGYRINCLDSLSNLQGVLEHQHPDVTNALIDMSTVSNALTIILMHVNRDKDFSGLKKVEHLVGCTAILRVDTHSNRRTLEVRKNRFGAAGTTVELDMGEKGLEPAPEQLKRWQ